LPPQGHSKRKKRRYFALPLRLPVLALVPAASSEATMISAIILVRVQQQDAVRQLDQQQVLRLSAACCQSTKPCSRVLRARAKINGAGTLR
jgi:hypothetical protein